MAGLSHRTIGLSFLALLFCANVATAQENERGFGFLEQLFGNGDRAPDSAPVDTPDRGGPHSGRLALSSDLAVRLDRLEAQIRQLTGALEQLQYRKPAARRSPGACRDAEAARRLRADAVTRPAARPAHAAAGDSRRRHNLIRLHSARRRWAAAWRCAPILSQSHTRCTAPAGTMAPSAPLAQSTDPEEPVGAPVGALALPGWRHLIFDAHRACGKWRAIAVDARTAQSAAEAHARPPTDSPKEFTISLPAILRRSMRLPICSEFLLRRFLNDRLPSDAHWLGESLFQRQRYRDAAEIFLEVSTKHDKSGRAPDSLLRLGQSLAGLGERDAACASLAEVGRKYPRASVSVKQGVEREHKRVRC
jgi:TolA-binding protein